MEQSQVVSDREFLVKYNSDRAICNATTFENFVTRLLKCHAQLIWKAVTWIMTRSRWLPWVVSWFNNRGFKIACRPFWLGDHFLVVVRISVAGDTDCFLVFTYVQFIKQHVGCAQALIISVSRRCHVGAHLYSYNTRYLSVNVMMTASGTRSNMCLDIMM